MSIPAPTEPPTIGCVIVNWNSRDDVLAGIRSLREQSSRVDHIVVVDNGSSDGSEDAIRAEFPDVELVQTHENLGFAEGCNRGIARARGDWILLFNNDAVALPGCIQRLREVARSCESDVGMIQPCIVFEHDPATVNSTGVLVFTNGTARDRHFNEPRDNAQEACEIFCTTAAAAIYRRTMLEQVRTANGYFDRRFFMYFEDIDLGWRCRLHGWKALYVADATVRHRFQGSSAKRGNGFVGKYCCTNRIQLLTKNASPRMWLRTLPRMARDLSYLWRCHGSSAALSAVRLIPGSLLERRSSSSDSRERRRSVERAWISPPETDAPPFRR